MSDALANLAKMPGVTACAVFDPEFACIAHHAEPPYSAALMQGAFFELHDAMTAMKVAATTSGRPIEELFVQATDGWVALTAHGALTVLAMGQSDVNLAMLKVATNVAVKRLDPHTGDPRRSAARLEATTGLPHHAADEVELVGLAQIRHLLSSLQRSLGGAAKAILTREMQAMNLIPTTVPVAQYPVLVERLGRRIDNQAWRAKFLDDAALR